MVSFAPASSPYFPCLNLATTPARRRNTFLSFSHRNKKSVSVLRRCKAEANWDLEGEILDFMKNSENPGAFPSRKELVDAGRMDLVDGIRRQGGWLSLGWDLDDNNVDCNLPVAHKFEPKVEENSSSDDSSASAFDEVVASSSMSGSSLDVQVQEDTGIHGILHRLEKERSVTFGIGPKETEDAVDDLQPGSLADAEQLAYLIKPQLSGNGDNSEKISPTHKWLGRLSGTSKMEQLECPQRKLFNCEA